MGQDARTGHGLGGWKLWLLLVGAIGAATLALVILLPGYDGASAALRLTARTSLVLFLLAFTASSLRQLMPGPATRWLLVNRRMLGLAFAGSHAIHLAVIVTYWDSGVGAFMRAQPYAGFVANIVGYAVLAAMAVTSFGPTRRAIGPAAWSALHTYGSYYLWLSFAKSFAPRAVVDAFYIPFVILLLIALLVRAAAWRQRTRQAAIAPQAIGKP